MTFVQDFHKRAAVQAVSEGIPPKEALAVASAAVFNRLKIQEGTAIAESKDFEPQRVVSVQFQPDSFSVDEASDGGTVIEGSLLTVGRTPKFKMADGSTDGGWTWTDRALKSVAEAINKDGIIGVADGHKAWRNKQSRDSSENVLDWVKAQVRNGQVWIKAKIKKGFEWVAKKMRGLSIESMIPKDGVRGNSIVKAKPVAFSFVEDGTQKRLENRIHSISHS